MLNQKISIIILICLKIIPFQYVAQDKHNSFSVDLIHIDSPLSPFYNKSMSRSELLARDVQRSHARVKRLLNLSSSGINKKYMVSEMTGTGNNYLMEYLLGSKKFPVKAFVSMTTNFIWTRRHKEGQDARPFGSTTYLDVPSDSDICKKFYFRDEDSISPNCVYDYLGISGGRYRSKGVVGTDDFFFPSSNVEDTRADNMKTKNIWFGCSEDENELDSEAQGVVGFGRGEISLVSQFKINKVSYCLRSSASKQSSSLKFGDIDPTIQGLLISTLLHTYQGLDAPYFLNLKGVTLRGEYFASSESPNLIKIDIGHSMTRLEKGLYEKITKKVSELFATETTPDFPLCFEDSKQNRDLLPSTIFHFEDADIMLKPSNVFVNNGQGMLCLAIFLEEFGPSIFGSQAQVDHVMQFDRANNLVFFTMDPLDCKSVKL